MGYVQIHFPGYTGMPENVEQLKAQVEKILPCHLEVEFYFRYLTWAECERAGYTWASVEAAGHTWDSFQLAVPLDG